MRPPAQPPAARRGTARRFPPLIAALLCIATLALGVAACPHSEPPPAVPAEVEIDWPDAAPLE